jgi:ribosomal protein L21
MAEKVISGKTISTIPIGHRQVYTNIPFHTTPHNAIAFPYRENFSKIRKRKRRDLKKKFGYRKGYTYIPRIKK